MSGRAAVAALIDQLGVPRETLDRLDVFVDCLVAGAATQNLVAASTLPDIWSRHIQDSLQLATWTPVAARRWLDIGSGAGLPGLVIAAIGRFEVTLAEPRRRRVEFLAMAAERMGIDASIHAGRAETLAGHFDVISARAVAALPDLLGLAHGLSHADTCLVLPKGRSARSELEAARRTWQGDFRIVPSVTDPEAAIVVATHVQPVERR